MFILGKEYANDITKLFLSDRLIARTFNVLNGYHDSVKIKISDNEQISNLIINLKKNILIKLKIEFKKEMLERNYSNEVIISWLEYVE